MLSGHGAFSRAIKCVRWPYHVLLPWSNFCDHRTGVMAIECVQCPWKMCYCLKTDFRGEVSQSSEVMLYECITAGANDLKSIYIIFVYCSLTISF